MLLVVSCSPAVTQSSQVSPGDEDDHRCLQVMKIITGVSSLHHCLLSSPLMMSLPVEKQHHRSAEPPGELKLDLNISSEKHDHQMIWRLREDPPSDRGEEDGGMEDGGMNR